MNWSNFFAVWCFALIVVAGVTVGWIVTDLAVRKWGRAGGIVWNLFLAVTALATSFGMAQS